MDITAAIGLVAAPAIVGGIVQAFKPLIVRWLTKDVIPPLSIVLGAGYCYLAWQAGVIPADNVLVAVLLGITVGLSAGGAYEAYDRYTH
jgi:hypothetical protein